MQWSDADNGGFSTPPASDLIRPVVDEGPFAYEHVNVADQRGDPDSLLSFVERLIGTRKECPEIGWGECEVVETDDPGAFAHVCRRDGRGVLAVHNLAGEPTTATVPVDEHATSASCSGTRRSRRGGTGSRPTCQRTATAGCGSTTRSSSEVFLP
jgi:maltose alpha-D-glucosyltransferase/alpha-amylase